MSFIISYTLKLIYKQSLLTLVFSKLLFKKSLWMKDNRRNNQIKFEGEIDAMNRPEYDSRNASAMNLRP